MKLESLTVIFLIIIIPISMVLSEYVEKRIKAEKIEMEYNTKLLNSTYDAIKAYQLNTVNNSFGDDANTKVSDLEAAANTFYNSLATNFNYTGYKAEVMKEYVPAIAFTLYDGMYIYSPFINSLVDVNEYDSKFSKKNKKTEGLKPYIYYSCRYQEGSSDFVITYTLDNYITIQGYINGFDENHYVYDSGYLISGIEKTPSGYKYDGIEFVESNTESIGEYLGETFYRYVKINGIKYYLEGGVNENAVIFYIDKTGSKNYSQFKNDPENTKKLYDAITKNKSAYEYYKNAYEFTTVVTSKLSLNFDYRDKSGKNIIKGYGLIDLMSGSAEYYKRPVSNATTELTSDLKIFDGNIHKEGSNFYIHKQEIIRYVVETNLIAAISNYSSNKVDEFIMPKINEEDWELIQDEPCAVSFMQGMNIGPKRFNGYKVVQNKLSKEHIDENDIYILTSDDPPRYCRVTDNSLRLKYKK